jgi:hypothetical protein
MWACGAVGSALPWHGRGRRFEPVQVHQTNPLYSHLGNAVRIRHEGSIGTLDQNSAEAVMDKVFTDIAAGLFLAVKLEVSHVDEGRALVAKCGYTRRMRTLNAL